MILVSCTFFLCFISFFLGVQSDCGLPPSIPNTNKVLETSGAVGQNIVYTCDRETGYYEIPGKSNTITCQEDGKWTNPSEFCTRACGVPKHLEFAEPAGGALLMNIFYPGETVSYQCRPGYTRVPGLKASITCLDDFTWSNPEKFCTLKSCGNPGEPENGNMDATDFVFGSRVTYHCDEGFSMKNSRNYRDCKADGTWSNQVPVCEAVICTPPEKKDNVKYEPEKEEYHYTDSVTFSCPKNLELVGTPSVACKANGQWSDGVPKCIAVNCKDPAVEHSRRRSGFSGPYTRNMAIEFECKEGFVLNGSSLIVCNANSQWEPGVPKCLVKGVNCKDPVVEHSIRLEGLHGPYEPNSLISFKCKEGFSLHGNNTIKCKANGHWEPDVPKCLCDKNDKPEPNVGLIIGIVFAVVIVVVAIIIFCCKCLKRQTKRGKPQPDALNVQYTNCDA